MSASTQRAVPTAGSTRRPWLWQVWAAILVGFVVLLVVHSASRPPLAITSPTLSFLGDTCTVSFGATNNTATATPASLVIITALGTPGGDTTPPSYIEFARNTVPVSLAPKETKSISSDFSVTGRTRPNTARIEIESTNN